MACNKTTLTVMSGFNNPATMVFGFKQAGVVSTYDFTATTRIVLKLYDSNDVLQATIDSDVSPTAITWSGGEGEVVFDLGGEGIAVGSYQAQMIVYDPAKPLGQLFVDEGEIYSFNVTVVSA